MTTTIAREAIWKAVTIHDRTILILSPSFRQSMNVMTKVSAVVDTAPLLYSQVERNTRTELEFKNRSRIISLPNSPDLIRGFTATDIYLDEAAHFLNDEQIMRVISPMLIAMQGRLTIISTPFGKRGIFYERYVSALNNPTARAYDFYPSTLNPLITDDDLQREHERLNDLEYRQEYGAEFLEEVDAYYPIDLISPSVDAQLVLLERGEEGKHYIYGIDFAKKRDQTVVFILERMQIAPPATFCYVTRHIAAWDKMDYSDQLGRIGQLRQLFPCELACADQTGVGESIIEDLKHVLPPAEGVIFSVPTKIDMAARLRALMESTKIARETQQVRACLVLPNDKKLITQINSLRYEVSKVGNVLFKQDDERVHDDYLWALALAVYAAREPPLVVKDLFGD